MTSIEILENSLLSKGLAGFGACIVQILTEFAKTNLIYFKIKQGESQLRPQSESALSGALQCLAF